MAGSYNHAVDDHGRLLNDWNLAQAMDTQGDTSECIEQMYGMIWYLADRLATAPYTYAGFDSEKSEALVDEARANYMTGLGKSPGRQPQADDY